MNSEGSPPLLARKDEEHLRLLATFHYVVAGIGAIFACFPLIHVAIGVMMIVDPASMSGGQNAAPPRAFGYFFAVIGTVLGIFTIIVLSRDSVQRLYDQAELPRSASQQPAPNVG